MKTLDEVLKEYAIECGNPFGGNICAMDIEGVKEVANRFAKYVAQQALENASENAKMKESAAIGEYNLIYVKVVDKSSITNPDNIPTL